MRWVPFALCLLACEPVQLRFGVEPIAVPAPPAGSEWVWLEPGGVTICEDPAARATAVFDRRAHNVPQPAPETWFWSGGAIVADLDGDGWHDIVTPTETVASLYRNLAGTDFPETEALDAIDLTLGAGGSAADYDADGDLDLLITRCHAPTRLLRNDGDGSFVDVTESAGLDIECPAQASAWADIDGDADLDLFVGCTGDADHYGATSAGPGAPSALFVNEADGTFQDRSAALSREARDGYTYAGGFVDFDADGWPDLYFVNDYGQLGGNVALMNRAGSFVIDQEQSGLDVVVSGTGLAVTDLNGDDLPDLLVNDWADHRLLVSGPDGWTDVADDLGLVPDTTADQWVAWGAEFGDMDNDGLVDAVVSYGSTSVTDPEPRNTAVMPDALFLQQADGHFVDVATAWGLDDVLDVDGGQEAMVSNRGLVLADLNADGWLDVVKRDLDGPSVVHLSHCGDAAWLRVRLHHDGQNTFGIGARIAVEAGSRRWTRTITAGGGSYASAGPPEAHFGLGDVDRVDAVEVRWPDGRVTRFADVDARQVLNIHRAVLYGPMASTGEVAIQAVSIPTLVGVPDGGIVTVATPSGT